MQARAAPHHGRALPSAEDADVHRPFGFIRPDLMILLSSFSKSLSVLLRFYNLLLYMVVSIEFSFKFNKDL